MLNSARRRILSSPIPADPYLMQVARTHPSHAFLSGATHGCYLRQVALLVSLFRSRGREPGEVRVLDWGAGKGHVSYLLKSAGFDVVSCDVRNESTDSAFGQSTPILVEQGVQVVPLDDPWRLPFQSGSFDLVVSFGVLEHVPQEQASLGEIARVLRSNGVFFFCFLPYWLSWTQRLAHLRGDYYHARLYRTKDLRRLLEHSGLRLSQAWHGQLLPKNVLPASDWLERLDRLLTDWTPLKFLATNLEGIALRP